MSGLSYLVDCHNGLLDTRGPVVFVYGHKGTVVFTDKHMEFPLYTPL